MGVVSESSNQVAKHLADRHFCIMPTSAVYCEKQRYVSREDEVLQAEERLRGYRIDRLALIVASSIGVDSGMAFSTRDAMPVEHVF